MRWRIGVLAAVVCIAVLMLTFGIPTAAARGTSGPTTAGWANHTIVVLPNGHDDTSDLQAAFNACVSYGPGCTVQLVKGTYYTAQIAVFGFQGSFVGAGQGLSVIQALPNLPPPSSAYNTVTNPFWAAMPGPTNPWPILLTFVNGAFRISGMTLTDTDAQPVQAWYDTYGGPFTNLWDFIQVTGESGQLVTATVVHVTIVGGAGDSAGFNNGDGVAFGGMLLPAGWTDPLGDAIPLAGSLSVTNSSFVNAATAVEVFTTVDATCVASHNSVVNTIAQSPPPYSVVSVPFFFFDLSNSLFTISGNQVYNVADGAGVWGLQSVYKYDLQPSTVYITGNDFLDLNTYSNGVLLVDYEPFEGIIPSSLSAVISGNVLQTNTSCGCYGGPSDIPAIGVVGLQSAVISQNLILGGGEGIFDAITPGTVSGNTVLGVVYIGIGVDADDVLVTGNLVLNSAVWGIAVFTDPLLDSGTIAPNDNLIAHNVVLGSGQYDLYWDGTGTGNHWMGNVYKTSYPAILP